MSDSIGTVGTALINHHSMISATGGEKPIFQEGMYNNNNMFNVYTQWYKYHSS